MTGQKWKTFVVDFIRRGSIFVGELFIITRYALDGARALYLLSTAAFEFI